MRISDEAKMHELYPGFLGAGRGQWGSRKPLLGVAVRPADRTEATPAAPMRGIGQRYGMSDGRFAAA